MLSFQRYGLILCLILFAGYGFAQKKKKKEKSKTTIEQPLLLGSQEEVSNDLETKKSFLQATQKFVLGDFSKALDEFIRCEKLAPKSAAVKYKIAHCHYLLRNFMEAEVKLLQAIALDQKNRHYYLLLVDVYANQNKYDRIIETYKNGLKNVANSQEWYYDLAGSYLYLGKTDEALKYYYLAESHFGISENINKQIQRIYLGEKKIDLAIKESEKLLNAFPTEKGLKLEHAELLYSAGKTQQSLEILMQLSKDEEIAQQSKLSLATIYAREKMLDNFSKIIDSVLKDNTLELTPRLDLLQMSLSLENDYAQRLMPIAEQLASDYPDFAQTQLIYADFLSANNQSVQARVAYKKSLDLDANQINVWMKLLNQNLRNEMFSSLIEDAEEAVSVFPNFPQFYFFLGLAHSLEKNYSKARSSLEYGRKLASGTELEMDFVSQLGDIYHYLAQFSLSDEMFDWVLKQNPQDLHALNNHSYFLAVRGEQLEKARKQTTQLISISPDNPTYLDTHGWVLYKMGLYVEAEISLLRAVELNPKSGVLNEHYGDVLFKLNKVEEAMKYWKKAQELGGSENPKILEFKVLHKKME
jgi:tetratricopeptide (TPR) repeat protein